jgi:hypothetical protein
VALGVWSLALIAFWQGARQADVGPLDYLLTSIEHLAARPWAPAGVLALYLVRPLVLVPITVVNLASGFVLGACRDWRSPWRARSPRPPSATGSVACSAPSGWQAT